MQGVWLHKVSIIILAWNCLNYTKACLESVRSMTDYPDYEVWVVNNNSTDGTKEYLDGLGWVRAIHNDSNVGFVRGNNIAIKRISKDRDILLLNNDTLILQRDWLSKLVDAAYSGKSIGIAGCRFVTSDGKLLHAGAYMPRTTFWGQQIGGGETDLNQFSSIREVESVTGACFYIKRELLGKMGGLDPAYFSYFEDTDYCLRAKTCGYKTICAGNVTILHYENASTKENRADFSGMFRKSQQIFIRTWKPYYDSLFDAKLSWHSMLSFPSGYAESSRYLLKSLYSLGVDARYRYIYGPRTVFPLAEPDTADDYMINEIKSRKFEPGGTQVAYSQADVFYKNSGDYKIGYTMLEVDGIPDDWARQSNLMDEVWVPSPFNKKTFRKSGVKVPIRVMPLGVDQDHFNPQIRRFKFKEPFVFLSIFEWGERKAPEILLKGFNEEFSKGEGVALVLKVLNTDASVDIRRQIAEMGLKPGRAPIYISYNSRIPHYQLASLYRSADCFVLTTRGEGWGLPIIEAMACGLPVIATGWSAHTSFMNKSNAFPLKTDGLVPAEAKCPYYEGFSWANPDLGHLRHLMRHVYENRDEARAKGLRASKDVLGSLTWHNAALRIRKRLKEIG